MNLSCAALATNYVDITSSAHLDIIIIARLRFRRKEGPTTTTSTHVTVRFLYQSGVNYLICCWQLVLSNRRPVTDIMFCNHIQWQLANPHLLYTFIKQFVVILLLTFILNVFRMRAGKPQ